MTREERQALLHEGTGPATISAYVEVIFDNSDNRFPTGKDEVVLRRTIGLKKDEYSLDRKSTTKAEVLNLLESAGFSRSNPYYIVPQGRIMTLTNSKDHERLQLLKEVAGTKVYEQRRQESTKIMEETKIKQTKIKELLNFINERLAELEKEKDELQRYQKAERERRCLEYAIHFKEQRDAHDALSTLETRRQQELDNNSKQFDEFAEFQMTIQQLEEDLERNNQQLKLLQVERQHLEDQHRENIRTRTQLELAMTDREESGRITESDRDALLKERRLLEQQIQEKSADLATISPDFENLVRAEADLLTNIEQMEAELKLLQSKTGRSAQFRSRADRDRWLRTTVDGLQTAMQNDVAQAEGLEEDIQRSQARSAEISSEIETTKTQMETIKADLEQMENDFRNLRRERETLELERKNMWKDEASISAELENARDEYQKCERILYSTIDRSVANGLRSVRTITERLGLKGVHGPLYELFNLQPEYACAVEVVASNSLFHIVVDDDEIATKLLQELSKMQGGRVTFMPLNRLHPREEALQRTDDMIPMIDLLDYPSHLKKAFVQVFGKAVLCSTIEMAAKISQDHGLTAVTMDGDRADRKGTLSGGFQDSRHSRLEAARKMGRSLHSLEAGDARLRKTKTDIVKQDQLITQIRDRISKLEIRRRETLGMREPLSTSIQSKQREQLQLNELIEQAKIRLAETAEHRIQLEGRRNILNIEITTNLTRSLHDVIAKLESQTGVSDDSSVAAAGHEGELERLDKLVSDAADRIKSKQSLIPL
eukprot:jgi/Hompol1/4173/HPOL_003548-RA